VTQVLLVAVLLVRRADLVELIGAALLLLARGVPVRRVARSVGVPRSTVRGWAARLSEGAQRLRGHFTRWLVWLAPQQRLRPTGAEVGDAVAAIVAAGRAAVHAQTAGSVWRFASAATSGQLLGCNTDAPFPAPWNG